MSVLLSQKITDTCKNYFKQEKPEKKYLLTF